MLLKLLKYDFRAMWKHFSLIWGAALALGLVNRLTHSLWFIARAYDFDGSISNFTSTVLLVVFAAMFVLAISFVTQRFSKGLLGSEGYLMHTLPVRSWQLVLSKLICAIAACVVSAIVAVIAILLMFTTDLWEIFDLNLWNNLVRALGRSPETIAILLEFCLLMFSTLVEFIASVYLAISIGHLFGRHRKAISIASFIGLYILVNNIYFHLFQWDFMELIMDTATETIHGTMLGASASVLAPAVIFLLAVCWILDHNLNLE